MAVEFHQPGEGDVIEVHVEAHADGIGRHQVIDLARLEQTDLRVARARTERAEHDRGAALAPAHGLGERENVGDGERHDGAARRQARQLLGAGVRERREPRPRRNLGVGHQTPQQRRNGVGA